MAIGTAHFISTAAAIRYYKPYGYNAGDVREKLARGEIAIGEPKQVDGTPYPDCRKGPDGRYWLGDGPLR